MAYLKMINNLWQDDCGGIISSEYVLLGSVMTLGTVQGMSAMRDATVDEMREMGSSIRAVREQYTPKQLVNQRTSNTAGSGTVQAPTGRNAGEGVCLSAP